MTCNKPSVVYIRPKDPDTERDVLIPEGSTCIMEFKLQDPKSGQDVPNSSINSAVMRIHNESDKSIIQVGGVDDTNVKTAFNASGQFSYLLEADANKMVSDDEFTTIEVHWARFTINFTSNGDIHNYIFNYKLEIENNVLQTSS